MNISELLNFLKDNPNTTVPFPWKQIYDVETGLIFYKHIENGFFIYDFRPLVNIRRGVFWNNFLWSASIDCPDTRQMITNSQNSDGVSSVYLFCITCCDDITIYCIVDQPVFRCFICNGIVGRLP
ncbi:uncharacterized protein LOC127135650 [Lathyrus oleraceus]|nr:uncharacterized protein LOC127135650 [Pisum sativum]